MPDREQILNRIKNLQDSSVSTWKDREYAEDEVWRGEEYGARFEVTIDESIDSIWLSIQGKSLIGKRRLLEEFKAVLGEPTLPGNGLPKQHLFAWSKDSTLERS